MTDQSSAPPATGAGLSVAGIQADLAWLDRDRNHAMAREEVTRAATAGARLVVLPEMWPTGFSMDTAVTAEPPDGPSASLMAELATAHDVWVAGSFACLQPDGLPTNRLQLVGPDGATSHYDKMHPFSFADEDRHYAAGTEPVVADVDGLRVGLTVCYDLRFANLYWGMASDVDLYVVVANWPTPRRAHWRVLLRARAIENQAWVLGVNRVGDAVRLDGGALPHSGDSMLVDPLGEVVASAAAQPTMLLGEVTADRVAQVRGRFPFMADRV